MSDQRVRDKKDPSVELFLERLNDSLLHLEGEIQVQPSLAWPVYFIVGHQRSGSTLLSQLLCKTASLGYPTNFIARFWRAPKVGITLQNILMPNGVEPASELKSMGGVTEGLWGPHEFSYFWREWFPRHTQCKDPEAFKRLVSEMTALFGQSLVFKNLWNTLRMSVLKKLLPQSKFILVRRNLIDVAISTYEMRCHRYGDPSHWVGLDPEGWENLRTCPPAEQIAKQIRLVEDRVQQDRKKLGVDDLTEVNYSDLCGQTNSELEKLMQWGMPIEKKTNETLVISERRRHSLQDQHQELVVQLQKLFTEEEIANGGLRGEYNR